MKRSREAANDHCGIHRGSKPGFRIEGLERQKRIACGGCHEHFPNNAQEDPSLNGHNRPLERVARISS
jgi:hypothetical protein